jgi:hypothetical protein
MKLCEEWQNEKLTTLCLFRMWCDLVFIEPTLYLEFYFCCVRTSVLQVVEYNVVAVFFVMFSLTQYWKSWRWWLDFTVQTCPKLKGFGLGSGFLGWSWRMRNFHVLSLGERLIILREQDYEVMSFMLLNHRMMPVNGQENESWEFDPTSLVKIIMV